MTAPTLDLWVIYEKPKDYPNGYVVRHWTTCAQHPDGHPDQGAWYTADLRTARERVPPGKYRLPRFPDDDPKILEVWL